MAREFKAFARVRKIKTPAQLLRVVLLYCGVDKALREVAGILTALYEPITDQSVAERLRACGPWVKAVLRKMLPTPAATALPQALRFVVIDATTVQAPGATGTDYRLHISLDLVTLEFLEVSISDVHTGETLELFLNKREQSSTVQHRRQSHRPQRSLCDCGSYVPKCCSASCRQSHARQRCGPDSRQYWQP